METDDPPTANLSARPYQLELFNKAKERNSIVYLGTGAGKTFIATLMIKELGWQIREQDRRTVFLVNTQNLLTQQAQFFRDTTPFSVRSFCGLDGVDDWTKERWRKEIEQNQILVMVHDVFRDLVHKSLLQFGRINLLIIDECHHTIKNSPYSQIMAHYHQMKASGLMQLPRILGLSASVVTQHCTIEKFVRLKMALEDKLDAKVVTTKNLASLLKYVTMPDEFFLPFSSQMPVCWNLQAIHQLIEQGVERMEALCSQYKAEEAVTAGERLERNKRCEDMDKTLKLMKNQYIINFSLLFEDLGIYAADAMILLFLENLGGHKKSVAESKYELELIKAAENCLGDVQREIRKLLASRSKLSEKEKLRFWSTNKVNVLFDKLAQIGETFDTYSLSDGGDGNCDDSMMDEQTRRRFERATTAVIFVEMRQTAVVLSGLLSKAAELLPNLSYLRLGYAVGQQSREVYKNKGKGIFDPEVLEQAQMVRKKLNDTLDQFKRGQLNCLVSTAVLEEGMDVRQCNLVIRFDSIKQFRSYVQSKGRARARPSKFIMMVSEGELPVLKRRIAQYREIESMSIDICHDMIDIDEDEDGDGDDEIEEYLADPANPTTSPRITSLTAVSSIHRYVQSLPTDKFTKLTPYWEYTARHLPNDGSARSELLRAINLSGGGGRIQAEVESYKCIVHLPHLTPLRDPIFGLEKSSKIAAKRSAALIAIQKLHECGELGDDLRPKKKDSEVDSYLEDDDDADDETLGQRVKPGTKRRKEYYDKTMVPKSLACVAGRGRFLYRIDVKLVDPIKEEMNRKQYGLYRPEVFERKLGLITSQRLDEQNAVLRPFYLFMYSGRVRVDITLCRENVQWSQGRDAERLLQFNRVVFADAVRFVPDWIEVNANIEGNDDVLVCPVRGGDIDWNFVNEMVLQSSSTSRHKSENGVFAFNADDFVDRVVVPNHKAMDQRFIVEEVVTDMSAMSLLPDDKTTSFAGYFTRKYGAKVTNLGQPLLRVSNADKKYDMRHPIVQEWAKKAKQKTREEFLSKRMLLLPELVDLHHVPASFWRECQLLPFVFYRINCFTRAQQMEGMLLQGMEGDFQKSGPLMSSRPLRTPIETFAHLIRLFGDVKAGSALTCPSVDELKWPLTLAGAGEAHDLEREEILGDSFLKFSTSLYLYFNDNRLLDEGRLSLVRSRIVGNKNLCRLAKQLELPKYIVPEKFEPHNNWMPPRFAQPKQIEDQLCRWDCELRVRRPEQSFTLFQAMENDDVRLLLAKIDTITETEKEAFIQMLLNRRESVEITAGIKPREHYLINDKSLADVVEALIGCFLINCGQSGAYRLMSFLGVNPDPASKSLDWLRPPKSALHAQLATSGFSVMKVNALLQKIDVGAVEDTLGYCFKEKTFLLQALTHCSYSANKMTDSYERLEFLGDAILDYLVTAHIFTAYDKKSPGQVTDLRSALVNNNTFAKLAVESGLYAHLQQYSAAIMNKVEEYVSYVRATSEEEEEAAKALVDNLELHNEETCPLLEDIEVPKVLGDLVESLMGAIFLDSQFDLARVWRSFRLIFPQMEDVARMNLQSHVKELGEHFPGPKRVRFLCRGTTKQGKANMLVAIGLNGQVSDDVLEREQQVGVMYFRGLGNNKRRAKEAAATCAVRELKKRKLWWQF